MHRILNTLIGTPSQAPVQSPGSMTALRAVLLLAAVLVFAACEQVIEIDLPEHTPQLVLNATFSPDSLIYAQVSASKHLQDTAYLRSVNNAKVVVYENGVLWDSLTFAPGSGFDAPHYRSSRLPVAGRTYRVQVSAPGFADVEGEDRIPMPVPILSIERRDSVPGNNPEDQYTELSVTFDDPAGQGDAYVIGFYFQDTVETDPGQFEFWNFPIAIESADPVLKYDFNSSTFTFADKTFDGRRTTIKIRVAESNIFSNDFYVVLGSVSDHYFRYQRTLSSYLETAFNPFAEPVIVHSNMSSKMGIFAGYSMSRIQMPE